MTLNPEYGIYPEMDQERKKYPVLTHLRIPRVPSYFSSFRDVVTVLETRIDQKKPAVVVFVTESGLGKSTIKEELMGFSQQQVNPYANYDLPVKDIEWGRYINKAKALGLVDSTREFGLLKPEEFDNTSELVKEDVGQFIKDNQYGLCFVAAPPLTAVKAEEGILTKIRGEQKPHLPFPGAVIGRQYIGLNRCFTTARDFVVDYEAIIIGINANEALSLKTMTFRTLLARAVKGKDEKRVANLFKVFRIPMHLQQRPLLEIAQEIVETSGSPTAMKIIRDQANGMMLWLDRYGFLSLPKTGVKIAQPNDFYRHPRYRERAFLNFLYYLIREQIEAPLSQTVIFLNRPLH